MQLDLEQFIFALSDTVDLVGVDEILHSKRVGYMAWKCAETLGFTNSRQRKLLHLGLLHDCGVSSTEERDHLVNELEWNDSITHCKTGSDRMAQFGPLQQFSTPIKYHHTRWEKMGTIDLDDNEKIESNLLFLLDRVDYLCQITPGNTLLSKKDTVRDKINRYKWSLFNGDLTDCFLDISSKEAFWFSLEPIMLYDFIEKQRIKSDSIPIDVNNQLKIVAELFAGIVDAKSSYTAEHSFGVARLSQFIAEEIQLDRETCEKIKVAGLLHDLGKLQVPDTVLEHPGPLVGEHLSYMKHHSYVTYRILSKIDGLQDIALWAGNHHEALDGSGYPFRKTADELGIESRIIAVADIFQALAQARPYRSPKPLESILDFLEKNTIAGRIDHEIVEKVLSKSDLCYQVALGNNTI